MKGRDALREMLNVRPAAPEAEAPTRRSSGAIKAMNLGLQRLSDEAATARSLRASLAEGEQVVQLAPSEVDDSFISDRIAADADPSFAELKAAIEAHGQQVPILVRPHPETSGRYQAAYGHRRLRAARELGLKVKAIVRMLSDAELIIAQGQENNERLGLSFIERALFAFRLEQRGFERPVIAAATGVGLPELSRLIGVATATPASLILTIGPAPKVGRPRWMEFAKRLETANAAQLVEKLRADERFQQAASDLRFELAFAAAMTPMPKAPKVRPDEIQTPAGRRVGRFKHTAKSLQLESRDPAFVRFLAGRMPQLLEEFDAEGVPENTAEAKT